jgi:hypothetical protein
MHDMTTVAVLPGCYANRYRAVAQRLPASQANGVMRRCIRTICRRGLWLVAFIGLLYLGCCLHLRQHHDLVHVRRHAGNQVLHTIRAGMPDGPSVFVAMLSTNHGSDPVAIETVL